MRKASGNREAALESILLNGITRERVTSDEAANSPGHANRRAHSTSGASASVPGCACDCTLECRGGECSAQFP